MSTARLSDAQWDAIRPHLPERPRIGRPRADDRAVLDAILFVMRSGCRWADLPPTYAVHPSTAWRRLGRWEADSTWERIWRAFLASLDAESKLRWAEAFLDGTFVPAKRGVHASD